MACSSQHSLAVSERTGTVFSWGYSAEGRLGLGENHGEAASKSEQDPIEIPFFAHSLNENQTSKDAVLSDDPLMNPAIAVIGNKTMINEIEEDETAANKKGNANTNDLPDDPLLINKSSMFGDKVKHLFIIYN